MLTLFKEQTGNEFFTIIEALEVYIESLSYYADDNFKEIDLYNLHNSLFNTNDYLVYYNDIKQALESFGIFKAFEIIEQYHEDMDIDLTIKISDMKAVIDMLWYILGELLMHDIISYNNYNDTIENEDQLQKIIVYLIKRLRDNIRL